MKIRARFSAMASVGCVVFCLALAGAMTARAQEARTTNAPPEFYGPWNAEIASGGNGLDYSVADDDLLLKADAPWTLLAWVNATDAPSATELVAGMGAPEDEYSRYLALAPGKALLYLGQGNTLEGMAAIAPGTWHLLAATFDGTAFRLYVDGEQVAASGLLEPGQTDSGLLLGDVSPTVQIGPAPEPAYFTGTRAADEAQLGHFGGKVYGFTILRAALAPSAIQAMAATHPDFALPVYDESSKPWPVQTYGQAGYRAPQSPDQMPHSRAPLQQPQAIPAPSGPAITVEGEDEWRLDGGWELSAAPQVTAEGAQISVADFNTKGWYAAVVPGTVLTTLVDRGVYPNPYYGLNNLAIPETLNKQDYWYRTAFRGPESARGKRLTLTFEGINYKAEVWLNGQRLGEVKGAFLRGVFDVTSMVRPGKTNVLAVLVSPPPHPGIPQEQSIKGGPGENGGMMCLDGPTFVATEGWDWIPGIRDRDTGIWQPVVLRATENVTIGDPQVVTTFPRANSPAPGSNPFDLSRADVAITVPLTDAGNKPVHAKVTAEFEGVTVTKEVDLEPGESTVQLTPGEFAQLTVQNPRLWWPNGYGPANLYHLKLTAAVDERVSDTKTLQFGIREITYDLSLLDPAGHLVRVNFSPTAAWDAGETEPAIDNTHGGIRDIPVADAPPPNAPPSWREFAHAWVESLTPAGEHSAAIAPSSDLSTAPYLVILVNGVRIAVRGGNWGMDDAMKDVSRAHLEPYFRLHHDAGENVIRNWVGQSTEATFYDLADEYGLLVWNDFWASTQNYNIEPQNPALFLKNARDVILRFRNHPSIAVWCGRNEGVPQPIISNGLAKLVRTLDGTRYYSPSSNEVDLQGSGPYKYQDPTLYYTTLNHGFSVETGSPSMSTLESFEAWTPKADWWPMDDVWAYHDWHFMGNGDIHPLMAEMQAEFGAPTSLEDFERKAQMMDYVDYRAIFEGMNAHLWQPNSGRLLWMTQPAWPSNMWEVLSYDYDTQSSYYGEKEALQPLHIQLDLATDAVDVVNATRNATGPLTATADVYSLANKLLLQKSAAVHVAADNETSAMMLNLAPLEQNAVILVELQLKDASGQVASRNLYWLAGESRDFQQLARLPQATVTATATSGRQGDEMLVTVQLKNTGTDVALQNKLTLVNALTGKRILPAYYSDNYVSLLPGEAETVTIEYPSSASAALGLTLRGFNLAQRIVGVAAGQ